MAHPFLATDAPTLPAEFAVVDLWLGFFLALVSAATILWGAQRLYNRTLGRRRQLERDLHQVVAGGRLARVERIFGPAVFQDDDHLRIYDHNGAISRTEHLLIHTWASADHVLRCWVDDTQHLVGWLVTSRSSRFKPTWRFDDRSMTLRATKLGELGGHVDGWMRGANWFAFTYAVGMGRPLAYQHIWAAISEHGLLGEYGSLLDGMLGDDRDAIRAALDHAARESTFDTLIVFDRVPVSDSINWGLLSPDLARIQNDR